jgi:hypothetical protein
MARLRKGWEGCGRLHVWIARRIVRHGPTTPSNQTLTVMAYRKRKGYDAWHWCQNCSRWPTSDYEEQQTKPTTGELCNECKSKESDGECRK